MAAYDGVIEAVRYAPDGQVDWVRAYERRGAAFLDGVILSRSALVAKLQQGKHFVIGRRLPNLGGSFDTSIPVRLVHQDGGEVLVTDHLRHATDSLAGVPTI